MIRTRKKIIPNCGGNHLLPSLLCSCRRHWIEDLSGELLPVVNLSRSGGGATLSLVWQTKNRIHQHTKDGKNIRRSTDLKCSVKCIMCVTDIGLKNGRVRILKSMNCQMVHRRRTACEWKSCTCVLATFFGLKWPLAFVTSSRSD